MKRICGWCNDIIDEGLPSDESATWGICVPCKTTLDGQIDAVGHLQAEYGGRFSCANCPRDGLPYRMSDHGNRRSLYIRCPGCGVRWIVEV